MGSPDRPCPQREILLEAVEVRRPFSWAREGEPKPAQSTPRSPRPSKAPQKPEGWRAREWRRLLDKGVYSNQSALARGEGVSAAAVSKALAMVRTHAIP
jgi:hypothetical protein